MVRDNANLVEKLRSFVEHEPVRFMEMARVALFAIAGLVGVTLNAITAGSIIALVAIVVSVFGSKQVRKKVTPYWKVESGSLNADVQESLSKYARE